MREDGINPWLILLCLASLLTAVMLLAPSPPAEAPTQAVPGRSWVETTGSDIHGLPRGRTIRCVNGQDCHQIEVRPMDKKFYAPILEESRREMDAERRRRGGRANE